MGAEKVLTLSLKLAEEIGGFSSAKLADEALEATIGAARRLVSADSVSWNELSSSHWLPYRSNIGFELKLGAAADGSPMFSASTENRFMGGVKFDKTTSTWQDVPKLSDLFGTTAEPYRPIKSGQWYSATSAEHKVAFTTFSNKGPIITLNDTLGSEIGRARLDLATRKWTLTNK